MDDNRGEGLDAVGGREARIRCVKQSIARRRLQLSMAGKSTLCAEFIQHVQSQDRGTTLFFFCNFRRHDVNNTSCFLKIVTGQIVRQNQEMAGIVYEDFILKGLTPSIKQLQGLVSTLLKGLKFVRILVDGLDECEDHEQKGILTSIRDLINTAGANATTEPGTGDVKCAVFSRSVSSLSKDLKKAATINLDLESQSVQKAIEAFVESEISTIREELDVSYVDNEVLDKVKDRILASADGKYT